MNVAFATVLAMFRIDRLQLFSHPMKFGEIAAGRRHRFGGIEGHVQHGPGDAGICDAKLLKEILDLAGRELREPDDDLPIDQPQATLEALDLLSQQLADFAPGRHIIEISSVELRHELSRHAPS